MVTSTSLTGRPELWAAASALLLGTALNLALAWSERRGRRIAEAEAQEQRAAAERQTKLREEERKGRIRAELQLREGGSGAANAEVEAGEKSSPGFVFHAIGTFKSCYRNRCGTPRQGGIVSESLAVLQCARDLNPKAALEGFEGYSHCWVLYVFHLNTNLQREGRTIAKRRQQTKGRVPLWQGLCMKVAPPRAADRDLRVGVLSCRTPHRPNPVGLSLARIVSVDAAKGEVVLAGLDVVDGTPCLDLKPYLPSFESIPDALVPGWVQASHEEPMMEVTWNLEALEELNSLLTGSSGNKQARIPLAPFGSQAELRRALEGTLALDIRSPLQRERHANPGGSSETPFFVGDLWFHELHVTYALLPRAAGSDQESEEHRATAAVQIQHVSSRQQGQEEKNEEGAVEELIPEASEDKV